MIHFEELLLSSWFLNFNVSESPGGLVKPKIERPFPHCF